MRVDIAATARGFTRWTILDERGRPDERATRAAGGGAWNRNLITDNGLAGFALGLPMGGPTSTSAHRRYLYVCSGATPPAATDTALEAQVGSWSNDDLGVDDVFSRAGVGDDLVVTHDVTRAWTAESAVNLTKYGFRSATGGDLRIHGQFLDELGDPVTIALPAGKKIRIDHKMTLTIPRVQNVTLEIERYDITDTLTGTDTYPAKAVIFYQGTTYKSYYTPNEWDAAYVMTDSRSYPATATSSFDVTGGYSVPAPDKSQGWTESPPSGRATLGVVEGALNGVNLTAFAFGAILQTGSLRYGCVVVLDDPGVITKTSDERLEVTVRYTFARAA